MRLFFRILSLAYVSVIFLFADSSVVQDLSRFNPYSLLHVPLYGIMSLLFLFALAPPKVTWIRGGRPPIRLSHPKILFYSFVVGFIALGVAVADEYRQSFMPNRNGSTGDVLLDLVGVLLFLFLISWWIRSGPKHA